MHPAMYPLVDDGAPLTWHDRRREDLIRNAREAMYNRNGDAEAPEVKPPFVYEIKVKGRLSPEQWT